MKRFFQFFLLSALLISAKAAIEDKNYIPPLLSIAKPLSNRIGYSICINPVEKLQHIPPAFLGVNTTFRNGANQNERQELYQNTIQLLRYPAGSGSNIYFFDGRLPSSTVVRDKKGEIAPFHPIDGTNSKMMTPHIFAQFKQNIAGEATVVVNYFYARYGKTPSGTRQHRVQQAADYAARFVRKMNIELGANIKYWEIGNECYGKWEYGYDVEGLGKVTGKEYGEDFRVFARTMKEVDPNIYVGAVIQPKEGDWNRGVLPEVQNCADFLIVHEYFTTVKEASLSNVLAAPATIGVDMENIKACIEKYTDKSKDHFLIAMTEFNVRGQHNCSMINGITLSQCIGEQIKHGYHFVSLWTSEWKWSTLEAESKGFLALKDPAQEDYSARPSYLPFYYWNRCMGNRLVKSITEHPDLKVYASTFTSGEIGAVVVNTSHKELYYEFNLPQTTKAYTAYWYDCYGASIDLNQNYKKFFINGYTSSTTGGGPVNLNLVPPYCSEIKKEESFFIRPYSMHYVVLKEKTGEGISATPAVAPQLNIHQRFSLEGLEGFKEIQLYSLKGKLMYATTHISSSIDFSNYPKGVYLLQLIYSDKKKCYKIIKN